MNELVIRFENGLYNVSVTLDNSSFNKELLRRIFQIQAVCKNRVSACSNYKRIEDVSKIIENWFNIQKLFNNGF